jgi:ankyrin repeat protein
LESGASINHQDIYGNSVLTKAVVKGNEDAVIKLLANGADPALLDANGHNAMTWASASGFKHLEEIIRTRVEDEELFKKRYIDKINDEIETQETNSTPLEGEAEQ